jgi:Zn-dependent protease with chaperone function
VSSEFFERQEVQRSQTRWLVAGFVGAILAVVAVINLVVVLTLGATPAQVWSESPSVFVWVTLAVALTILLSCWHRSSQLRAGGAVVARSLGGVAVNAQDADLARQRLVNVVEEMAIAARVRKPQVFVLPDEQGINAFAAGHSPDEAAVAVTQGALDKLDRDQLQAVIGHEFSHILNGDMKINMRMAAWIFGLFVITDVASRIMSSGRGGKGAARIKLIAFAVFLAGSIGMIAGRLLQAAVSRRREHLADASAVQFTRNPGALQGAFIVMAAHAEGTRLQHPASADVAHMFFAGSEPSWANKVGGKWFATHPPIEERVHAIDNRVTPLKFKTLVGDARRKLAADAKKEGQPEGAPIAAAHAAAPAGAPVMTEQVSAAAGLAAPTSPQTSGSMPALELAPTMQIPALAETLPSGVRLVAGRALPPDLLRNRLAADQQATVQAFVAQVDASTTATQATFVATLLAPEPAKARLQLTRLAPLLGIELLKESQAMLARVALLPPLLKLPVLNDLLSVLDTLAPADRKRLRAIVRAFAPTVATGDLLRFSITRVLEKKLAKAIEPPPPVPLPDRSEGACTLYAALAQCRFGVDRQGQGSYRAGLMGMLPPTKWAPFPDALVSPAALDEALQQVSQVHPSGKRAFSDGLGRVISVGGVLTIAQADLLRGICLVVECPLPMLPDDVVYEDDAPLAQASAR